MERIRVGNDIAISWSLFESNGAAHLITPQNVNLSLCCGSYEYQVPEFNVENNIISFIFPAYAQTKTGKYKILLKEINPNTGVSYSIDVRDAFILVGQNEMLNVGYQVDNANISIRSILTSSNILNIKSMDIVQSLEDGGFNTVTFNLTTGESFEMLVKNGSKGEKGATGETGAQGPQGEKGETGDQGEPGVTTVNAAIGTNDPTQAPSVEKSFSEGTLGFVFNNIKGAKGDPGVDNAQFKEVDVLPNVADALLDIIYLVEDDVTEDLYHMWFVEADSGTREWKTLGTTAIQLGDYATKNEVSQLQQLGYVFAGIAIPSTNPGTPNGKVFYLAIQPGQYTYFDNLEVYEYTFLIKDTNWSRNGTGIGFYPARQDFVARYSKTTNLLDYTCQIANIGFNSSTYKLEYNAGKRISHLIPVNGAAQMTFSGFTDYGDVAVFLRDYNLDNIVDWYTLNNGGSYLGTRTISVPSGSKFVVATMRWGDSNRKVSASNEVTTDSFKLDKVRYLGEFGDAEYLSRTNNIRVPGSRTDMRITDDSPYFVSPNAYSVMSSIFIVKGLKRIIIHRSPNMSFSLGAPYLAFLSKAELKAANVVSVVDAGLGNPMELSVPDGADYAVMMLNTSMDRSTAPWDETTVSKSSAITLDEYEAGNVCKLNGLWIAEYQQENSGGNNELFSIEKTETERRAIPYSVGTPGGDVVSFNNSYERFNMLLFTDNHIDTNEASVENVVDVVKFIEKTKMPLDCVINCGDYITPFGESKVTATTRAQKFFGAIKESSIPVMQAIGNHDANDWTNPPQNVLVDSDWASLYFDWLKANYGTSHNPSAEVTTPYYFKDFASKKIRVICLNAEDIPHEVGLVNSSGYCLYYGGNAWYIRQAQFDWFVNTALDFSDKTDKDWGVIVFMHQDYDYGVSQLDGPTIVPKADGALRKVFLTLKALNTQSSYTDSYVCQGDSRFNLDIDADFSDYSGASKKPYVIGVFVGHEHVDNNKVYEGINLIYTANGSATMVASDARLARVVGSTTQNLFDIFSIDTTHRKIYATRYGAGLNCYGVGGDRFKPDGLSF